MSHKTIPYPTFELNGKVALVTGSSRGLGRWIALALAHAGADVAVTYRQAVEEGETVAGEIRDIMGTVIFLASGASDFVTGQTLCVDGGRTVL